MSIFDGKTIFVCVDSDEDTHLYIADDSMVDEYWEENPDSDRFACAMTIGRELTAEELYALPLIEGVIAY